jgi:hypothetical protein
VRETDGEHDGAGQGWQELADDPAGPAAAAGVFLRGVVEQDFARSDKCRCRRDRRPVDNEPGRVADGEAGWNAAAAIPIAPDIATGADRYPR